MISNSDSDLILMAIVMKRCAKCKILIEIDQFKNKNITCNKCLDIRKCVHDKRKDRCKICSDNFCIHNKNKYYCYQCEGKGSCIHDKEKARCKICYGNFFCIHGKQKYY